MADQLWNDGRHSWNSGMFAWRVDVILAEFERQMPALYHTLRQIEAAGQSGESRAAAVATLWPGIEPETIDYGIMEGARGVVGVPVDDLGWTDVGSWETLAGLLPADAQGNVMVGGEHIALDTRGALVYAAPDHDRRLIALIGLEELVVVDTPDVLLICPLSRSQEVREIVARLRQTEGGERYL
ncbi:MAG: hypothetical protein HY784_06095 [Chloroflexi bacterium]|nr:hypothetical protein [Chloroflexota bacterium]